MDKDYSTLKQNLTFLHSIFLAEVWFEQYINDKFYFYIEEHNYMTLLIYRLNKNTK